MVGFCKKRFETIEAPGPGSYDPVKPGKLATLTGDPSLTDLLPKQLPGNVSPVRNLMAKLRTDDGDFANKSVAFNSQASRFPASTERGLAVPTGRNGHLRSKTIADDDMRPVYELQMLEGPQVKARH